MLNRFYIYAHYDSNNTLKYIGKGSGNRAYNFTGRSLLWREYFKDTLPIVKLLEENLSESEAFEKEIIHIEAAIFEGFELLNICNGGYGGDTRNWTPEAREKLSKMRKKEGSYWYGKKRDPELISKINTHRLLLSGTAGYWKNKKRDPETMRKLLAACRTPEAIEKRASKMRGRKLSEEHKLKIGQAGQGRILSEETKLKISQNKKGKPNGLEGRIMPEEHRRKIGMSNLGKEISKEHREKISKGNTGRTHDYRTKTVLCLTTQEIFRCAKEAAKAKGCSDKHIQACCTGRRKTHFGLEWIYLENDIL